MEVAAGALSSLSSLPLGVATSPSPPGVPPRVVRPHGAQKRPTRRVGVREAAALVVGVPTLTLHRRGATRPKVRLAGASSKARAHGVHSSHLLVGDSAPQVPPGAQEPPRPVGARLEARALGAHRKAEAVGVSNPQHLLGVASNSQLLLGAQVNQQPHLGVSKAPVAGEVEGVVPGERVHNPVGGPSLLLLVPSSLLLDRTTPGNLVPPAPLGVEGLAQRQAGAVAVPRPGVRLVPRRGVQVLLPHHGVSKARAKAKANRAHLLLLT